MAAIPSATETVRDFGLNVVEPASMTPVFLGHSTGGTANELVLYNSITDLRNGHLEGPLVEEAALTLAVAGGPVGVMRMTAGIAATNGQVLPTYGANGTNGSVTSAGTTPPTVTVSGNPKGSYQMRIEITAGGSRGTAVFRWSIDNGATFVASGVTTAATVELKTPTFDTGLTAAFAVGTYNTDNTYSWTATPGGGTIAVSGSASIDARLRVEIVTSGALGAARFRYCVDGYDGDTAGERTYSENLYVPAGGTFAVPGLGVTLTFAASPTFAAGDIYTCDVECAACNATNLGTAATALAASSAKWRFVYVVTSKGNGDATAHAVLGAALQTHLTTLSNSGKYRRGIIASTHEDTTATTLAAWDDVIATRVMVPYGMVRRVSPKPYSGFAFPVMSAAGVFAARAADSLPSTDLKRVRSGPLSEVVKIFHDEFKSPSTLDDIKVSTLRTYENRDGFYITQGRLKSPDGSDFRYWPYGIVMDIACETVNAQLTEEIGRGVRTTTRTINNQTYLGTIDERDATVIEESVSSALIAQLLSPQNAEGFEGHITDIRFTVSRTQNVLSTGIIVGEVGILPLGHIDYLTTTLGFVVSLPEAA